MPEAVKSIAYVGLKERGALEEMCGREGCSPAPASRPGATVRHLIRRLHQLPPWITPRRAFPDPFHVHSLSPRLSEGAIPRTPRAVFQGRYTKRTGRPDAGVDSSR